nr:MAG TPA: Protein of unknown function (DUF551) [Caudoviricetes sp.]
MGEGGRMNVLEKILEEISKVEKEYVTGHKVLYALGATGMATEISGIIRSHMDDVPDNDSGWIPVSERLPEEGKEVLAQFTVRVVHTNNKVDEFVYIHTMYYENGAWKSFAGVPNGKVEAWQPLPEPYKEG